MRRLSHGLDEANGKLQARDRAVAALFLLGGKLRAITGGREPAPITHDVDSLLRAIEGEIIPRLMLVHGHGTTAERAAESRGAALEGEDHERFLDAVLWRGTDTAREIVDALLVRGVPRETILLELLGQAARRMGVLWEEDRCDFADVTIGLCRLHELLRAHSVVHERFEPGATDGPGVLLATACADQHVFGVVLVAEFFRRAGWRVRSEPGAVRSRLAAMLSSERFDVLGLSAACDADADEVSSEIRTFRKASANTELRVLVGGRLFLETPGLVAAVGADGLATDARSAPVAGRALLGDLDDAPR